MKWIIDYIPQKKCRIRWVSASGGLKQNKTARDDGNICWFTHGDRDNIYII